MKAVMKQGLDPKKDPIFVEYNKDKDAFLLRRSWIEKVEAFAIQSKLKEAESSQQFFEELKAFLKKGRMRDGTIPMTQDAFRRMRDLKRSSKTLWT